MDSIKMDHTKIVYLEVWAGFIWLIKTGDEL
jgi:hypothetical protein